MTLAKGLGGGVPIGAMLCNDRVADGFEPAPMPQPLAATHWPVPLQTRCYQS